MFKKLDYETDVSDFISENVRIECGEIALDVGANIGWYSILFSRLAGGGGSVFAFEPDPLNYKLLVENVKLNAAHSVLPCNLAVGEDCSTKLLFRYPDKNLGRHSLLPINAGAGIEVRCVALDEFLKSRGFQASAVRILKVDVEGYEIFVFRGASEVLRSVKVVVTEYIPRHMKNGGVNPEDFLNILYGAGLKPHVIRDKRAVPVSREEISGMRSCDLVWTRN